MLNTFKLAYELYVYWISPQSDENFLICRRSNPLPFRLATLYNSKNHSFSIKTKHSKFTMKGYVLKWKQIATHPSIIPKWSFSLWQEDLSQRNFSSMTYWLQSRASWALKRLVCTRLFRLSRLCAQKIGGLCANAQTRRDEERRIS